MHAIDLSQTPLAERKGIHKKKMAAQTHYKET
jgi:hypothetical protein